MNKHDQDIEQLIQKGKISIRKFNLLKSLDVYDESQLKEIEANTRTPIEQYKHLMKQPYIKENTYDYYKELGIYNIDQLNKLKSKIKTKEQIKELRNQYKFQRISEKPLPKDREFEDFIHSINNNTDVILVFEGNEERRIFEKIIWDNNIAIGHTDGTNGQYIYHILKTATDYNVPVISIIDNDEGGKGIKQLFKNYNKYLLARLDVIKINELLNQDYKDFEDYLIDVGILPKVFKNFFITKSEISPDSYVSRPNNKISKETKLQMIEGARSLLKYATNNKRLLNQFNIYFEVLEKAAINNKKKLSREVPLNTFKNFQYAIYGNNVQAIRLVKWKLYKFINLYEMKDTLYFEKLMDLLNKYKW